MLDVIGTAKALSIETAADLCRGRQIASYDLRRVMSRVRSATELHGSPPELAKTSRSAKVRFGNRAALALGSPVLAYATHQDGGGE